MAKAEGVERGYVGSLLRLTLLPPPMVEAILDGRQPARVTLTWWPVAGTPATDQLHR
jgi:hypothetical protein